MKIPTLSFRTALTRPSVWLAIPLGLAFAGHGLRTLSAPVKVAHKTAKAAPIHLHLTAERRALITDAQGQTQETWQPLDDGAPVQPGDTLRCTVRVENDGSLPVKNFVLTQPIPVGMAYLPNSASVAGADGVQVLFHAAGASDYSAVPTVDAPQPDGTVKQVPAPVEEYRAVRWVFAYPLAPSQVSQAVYTEKVR